MCSKMAYNPIEGEKRRRNREKKKGETKPLPPKHHFAHDHVRSKLYNTLLDLKCGNSSSILDVGCGSGTGASIYLRKLSENIVGVDISDNAIKRYVNNGFQGVLANVKTLPFRRDSFDYVVSSGLLHHLVGQGNLSEYLTEFIRVTKAGGYIIALEPNLFNPSGFLMNIFNTIKPGITGLDPHERALSPPTLIKAFKRSGLEHVKCIASSYVWNRFPLRISKFISKHEERVRFRKPSSLFGWWNIVYGQKMMANKDKR